LLPFFQTELHEIQELVPLFRLKEIVKFLNGLEFVDDFVLELAFVSRSSPIEDRPNDPSPKEYRKRKDQYQRRFFRTCHDDLQKIEFISITDDIVIWLTIFLKESRFL